MDFVKKFAGEEQSGQQGSVQQVPAQQSESSGGFLGGIGNKLNAAAGGGPESEKNEDYLDKGKLGILSLLLPSSLLTQHQVSTLSKRSSLVKALRYIYPCSLLLYQTTDSSPSEQRIRHRAGQGRANL